jgi:hypothetical protein
MRSNGLEDEEDGIRGMQKHFASDGLQAAAVRGDGNGE